MFDWLKRLFYGKLPKDIIREHQLERANAYFKAKIEKKESEEKESEKKESEEKK